ncbi:uncharacterized protein LOC133312672 [Gastrolobium bilobum]|uniref:uncharacterized protein LOC133312672 n=1 Tax=Gastrolobium bilobum TaxID=150636 RepID=UPI002AB08F0E|nr:uncharacterized protein LOC133312672 [Gastrolobium bilobum]
MEGLLPLVYRAIKKHKTRRQYECLSSGAVLSYNNFYPQIQDRGYVQEPSIQRVVVDDRSQIGHRRYNSVGDNFSGGFYSPQQRTSRLAGSPASKQLARFRSLKIFSCMTGA